MAAVGGGGGGQSAGGIRAGLAYVELIAKDKIGPALDKLNKKMSGLGSALTKGGAASLGAGAAILAPIVALATAGADRFDRMANEAKKLDLPIDQFYKLSTAAEIAGVSIEQLAEDPSKYADSLALVGEAPVEAIQAAAEASREWRATLIALKDASAGLLVDLVPLFKMVTGFVRENKSAVKVAAVVGLALAALGIGAIATGAAFNVLAVSVVVLKAALLLLLSPVGLVVAAVAGLAAIFLTQTESGRAMADELKGLFREIGRTFGETWGGIVAALQKGDLQQAFDVACAGIKVAWLQTLEWMTRKWVEFKADIATDVAGGAGGGGFGKGFASGFLFGASEGGQIPSAATSESLRSARLDLALARRQLAAAVATAQTPWKGPDGGGASIGDPISPAMMARARGVFSGPLGQQLGAGNTFQKDLLRGVRDIPAAVANVEKAVEAGNDFLRRALAFGGG